MTRAIGYVRRSTDRQEESLEQQRAKLEAFATERGWELVEVYADDAISGSELRRPGLEQLLSDATAGDDIEAVITWDRNRLARPKDALDGMLLERRITEAGKRVVYAATGQESGGGFASGIISYIEHHQNGDYLRKLSRDTMRGIVYRVRAGQWPGGPIPFGYDRLILDNGTPRRIVRDLEDGSQAILDPGSGEVVEQLAKGRRFQKQDHETCTLIPSDDARMRALQKLFADFANGKPTRTLRDGLNAAGFRTSRGSMFTVQTLIPMLENPAYVGRCVYNRRTLSKWHRYTDGTSCERSDEGIEKRPESDWITFDDAWPALVDAATFEAVQQRRKESRERHRQTTGRAVRANYLLTGLIHCGICGAKLTGMTRTSGKGYRTPYYVCSAHHAGHRDRCPKRYTVPAEPVESHVLELIRSDLDKLRDDDGLHEYIAAELGRASDGRSDARDQLQRRQAELDRQAAKLRDHLLALDPDAAQGLGLYDQAKKISEDRASVEAELANLGDALPELPDAAELRGRACEAFTAFESILAGGTLEEKRELIGLYVQRIEADPDRQAVHISLYPALFSRKIVWGQSRSGTLHPTR